MSRAWAAVFSVAIGTFAIVTVQLLPVGLVPKIAESLGVSEGTMGLTLTVPGFVAALAAPTLAILAGRVDRRLILMGLTALLVASSAISALATSFPVLLAGRVLVGLSVGGFWAIAGAIAARLVPEESIGRATATIFAGVSTATVAGVPLSKLIGDLTDWRTAFGVVGAMALLVLVAQAFLLPALPSNQSTKLRDLLNLLRRRDIRIIFGAVFVLVLGHFSAYTFVTPILRDAGLAATAITAVLLAYGGAGFAGNFLGGGAAQKWPRSTLMVLAGGLGTALLLLPWAGLYLAVALLVLWGMAYGATPVTLQMWLGHVVPTQRELGGALFVTSYQIALSLGALLGGFLKDSAGTDGALLFGGSLAILTAVALIFAGPRGSRDAASMQ